VYLHWLQEAGMLASAYAGFPLERYESIGSFWWSRRFRMEWREAVTYPEALQATTWISEFRRIHCNREYEIRRGQDGTLVFSGQANWVFVEVATGQPVRIPESILSAFPPRGRVAVKAFSWPELNSGEERFVFRAERRVRVHELDTMGHVNHATYLVWLLENVNGYADALGLGSGLEIAPQRLEIEYLHPAQEGDWLDVTCRLLAWQDARGTWQHEIRCRRDDTLVARAHSICRLEPPASTSADIILTTMMRGM
jgi:acyl-CoA thioester hydrolase